MDKQETVQDIIDCIRDMYCYDTVYCYLTNWAADDFGTIADRLEAAWKREQFANDIASSGGK